MAFVMSLYSVQLKKKFAALYADPSEEAIARRVANLIGDVTPVVSGSVVTVDLDQKIMEPIVVDWYLSVMPVGKRAIQSPRAVQPATEGDGM
jgi:hypothetical protein